MNIPQPLGASPGSSPPHPDPAVPAETPAESPERSRATKPIPIPSFQPARSTRR